MTYSISRRLSQAELMTETAVLTRLPRRMSQAELMQEAPDLNSAGRPAYFRTAAKSAFMAHTRG